MPVYTQAYFVCSMSNKEKKVAQHSHQVWNNCGLSIWCWHCRGCRCWGWSPWRNHGHVWPKWKWKIRLQLWIQGTTFCCCLKNFIVNNIVLQAGSQVKQRCVRRRLLSINDNGKHKQSSYLNGTERRGKRARHRRDRVCARGRGRIGRKNNCWRDGPFRIRIGLK